MSNLQAGIKKGGGAHLYNTRLGKATSGDSLTSGHSSVEESTGGQGGSGWGTADEQAAEGKAKKQKRYGTKNGK